MFLKYVFFLFYDCENDFEDKFKEKNLFVCSYERWILIYMFCKCLSLRLFFFFLRLIFVNNRCFVCMCVEWMGGNC